MKFSKNEIFRNSLSLIGILLVLDALYSNLIQSTLAIVLSTAIMAYLLVSRVMYTRRETNRIIQNHTKYWKYNRIQIDWNSLLMTTLLLYGQSEINGTAKYIILIQGILFLLLFVYNTINSIINNQQLLAIEANRMTNIRNIAEEIELSGFNFVEKTKNQISFKNRWRTIKVLIDDFTNSSDLLDAIESKLNIDERKSKSI